MESLRRSLKPAIVLLFAFILIGGVIYPLAVLGVSQIFFKNQAEGSLIVRNGTVVGSRLIGQEFDDPKYFWGRISATSPPYNGGASGGSNLGPTNPALIDEVKGRIKALRESDPSNAAPIPADLVTSSGSGLDPDISPAAALYQAGRIARLRNLPPAKVRDLIVRHIERPQWGVFGESRVNVLGLNLGLDRLSGKFGK
jgi:K+-transporting ATPase ATPase C chain